MSIGSILLEPPTTESEPTDLVRRPDTNTQLQQLAPRPTGMVTQNRPVNSILHDIETYGESDIFHNITANRHNDGSIGMYIPAELWNQNGDTPETKFPVNGVEPSSYSIKADFIEDKEGGRTVISVKPIGYIGENGQGMSITGSRSTPSERVEGAENSITISNSRKSTTYKPEHRSEFTKVVNAVASATRRLQELEVIKQNGNLHPNEQADAAKQLHVFDAIGIPLFRAGAEDSSPEETARINKEKEKYAAKLARIRRDIIKAT